MQRTTKMRTIKELREERRLTQMELAHKSMVSQTTIANWEQFRSTPQMIEFKRVCAVLGVPIDKVALGKYDRMLPVRDVIYHIGAHRGEKGYKARVLGIDFSNRQRPGDRFGEDVPLPGPLDPRDPETNHVIVPVTWRWEEESDSPEAALGLLVDRIESAFDRVYRVVDSE